MIGAMLSQDLALDLGSSTTRVHVRGAGVVLDLPSVIAVRTWRSGRREMVAVGEDARAMLGRTPDGLDVVRPIRRGRIADADLAQAFLSHLVRSVHGRSRFARPRIAVAVRPDASEPDLRAIRDSFESVGARDVQLAPCAVAGALGAGLDVDAATGHMVVDIGSGTTHIAVLCLREVVASATLDVAGDVMDGAVLRMLRRNHALLVGASTAEATRITLGAAMEPREGEIRVAGRCLRRGVPSASIVSGAELCEAIAEPVAAIGAAIRRVLEQTPPEIASDVVDHGVILWGGASQLPNLDLALRAQTGLAMLPVDDPERTVIRGVGTLLEGGAVFPRTRSRRSATPELIAWPASGPG